ncbi:hypothetical protein ACJDU8_22415 [Clostridium sp. WILCCON 0269]|uniref:Uncharacterized protein n=1 Tax=Candidatus Clostridium eludens TaxID=3381663 RepID=A0ABW8SSZ0_9CLOT
MLETERFYNRDWFMWIMFGTISPIGIILMWKNKRYHIKSRIITSILYLFYFLVISGIVGSKYSGLSFTSKFIRLSIFFVLIPYIIVHWDELQRKITPVLEKHLNKKTSFVNNDSVTTKTRPNTQPKFITKIFKYIEKQKLEKEAREKQLKQLEVQRQTTFYLYRQGKSLPRMRCNIILHKGEICHLACGAKRYEVKNKSVGYSGGYGGVSFRIAKGVSIHTGRSRGHTIRRDISYEYVGTLYITNKRVIFTGSNKNFSINLSKLLEYKIYSDGILFNTDKISYMVLINDSQCAGAILAGTVNNFLRDA